MQEQPYLQLIQDVLDRGYTEQTRNGVTRSLFGASMRFILQNGTMPLLTTKKVAWKTCLRELLWFISGDTNNATLQNQGVHIWNGNASRAFLDSVGLHNNEENDLGPVYGFQWRHFNGSYPLSCPSEKNGVDQLQQVIALLKNPATRTSRRILLSAWNPCQLDQMALPPCHVLCQFNVHGGNQLSCALYQRSGDVGLGVPFNIASYAFLTHLLAKVCGLEPFELVHFLGNCHIYEDHIPFLQEQIEREPFLFPSLRIEKHYENITDYKVEDFVVENYQHHPPLKMEMRP